MMDAASLTLVLGAIGTLVAAVTLGVKNLAEARATRSAAEQAARQVSPNHGSSVADAVKRIERSQTSQARSIGGIRDDLRQDREHLLAHLEDSREVRRDTVRRLTRLEALLLPQTAPSPPDLEGGPKWPGTPRRL